jgi:hypothetical protein
MEQTVDFVQFLRELFLACDESYHRNSVLGILSHFEKMQVDKQVKVVASPEALQPFMDNLSRDARVYAPLLSAFTITVEESPVGLQADVSGMLPGMKKNDRLLEPLMYHMEFILERYDHTTILRMMRASATMAHAVRNALVSGYQGGSQFSAMAIVAITGAITKMRSAVTPMWDIVRVRTSKL